MKTNRFMRRALMLLLATLSIAPIARTQADTTFTIPFDNAWALEFGIGSNLTVQPFLGGTLSGARYLQDRHKFRIGVGVGGGISDSDNRQLELHADTLYNSSNGTIDEKFFNIKLYAHYLTYAPVIKGTSIYAGLGPVAVWYSNHRTAESESDPPYAGHSIYRDENQTDSFALGADGVIGVEWFFSDRMSLHAEYGIQVAYEWGKSTQKETYPEYYYGYKRTFDEESSSSAWRVASPSMLFGITICY